MATLPRKRESVYRLLSDIILGDGWGGCGVVDGRTWGDDGGR